MPQHTSILYVEDPMKSAAFYEKLLQAKPVEASPGFARTCADGFWLYIYCR